MADMFIFCEACLTYRHESSIPMFGFLHSGWSQALTTKECRTTPLQRLTLDECDDRIDAALKTGKYADG